MVSLFPQSRCQLLLVYVAWVCQACVVACVMVAHCFSFALFTGPICVVGEYMPRRWLQLRDYFLPSPARKCSESCCASEDSAWNALAQAARADRLFDFLLCPADQVAATTFKFDEKTLELLPTATNHMMRKSTCHRVDTGRYLCDKCGFNQRLRDCPMVDVEDDDGNVIASMRGCATESKGGLTKYNRFHRRSVLRRRQDPDGTFNGKSSVYEYTEWGPTRTPRSEFFCTLRRSMEKLVEHKWHLHNERVAWKSMKCVGRAWLWWSPC